jgi:hypothetical protein
VIDPAQYLIRIGQKQLDAQQNDAGQLVVTVDTSVINHDNLAVNGALNIAFENKTGDVAIAKKELSVAGRPLIYFFQ